MKRFLSAVLFSAALLAKSEISWAPTHSNLAEGMCFFSSAQIDGVAIDALVDGKIIHRDGKPQHRSDYANDVYFFKMPIGSLDTFRVRRLNIEAAGKVYEVEPATSGVVTVEGDRR